MGKSWVIFQDDLYDYGTTAVAFSLVVKVGTKYGSMAKPGSSIPRATFVNYCGALSTITMSASIEVEVEVEFEMSVPARGGSWFFPTVPMLRYPSWQVKRA